MQNLHLELHSSSIITDFQKNTIPFLKKSKKNFLTFLKILLDFFFEMVYNNFM